MNKRAVLIHRVSKDLVIHRTKGQHTEQKKLERKMRHVSEFVIEGKNVVFYIGGDTIGFKQIQCINQI